MRFIIITGMLFISAVIYAQQERQMEKPDAVKKNTLQKSTNTVVTTSPPRQMVRVGDKATSQTTGSNQGSTVPSRDQKREMTPLNPNQVVKKKN